MGQCRHRRHHQDHPGLPPLNPLKPGLFAAIILVVLLGGYAVVKVESRPSAGHQLQAAWTALSTTDVTAPTASDLTRSAAGLSTFVTAIGRIGFPAA